MYIKLANPRGFCAGVNRAIEIVNRCLQIIGPPIYVRHEVVHNKFVVEKLRSLGAIFIENIKDVPRKSTLIFSAHGVSQKVRSDAIERELRIFDATCPLVTKVHLEVIRYSRDQYECILIGHAGHPEVEGTMGQYMLQQGNTSIHLVENIKSAAELRVSNPSKLGLVTQTTLSVDDTIDIVNLLKKRFPNLVQPRKDDICYATQNRQNAIKVLAEECDIILVIGSLNSSNSNRLKELSERMGTRSYLIDSAEELKKKWFVEDDICIGITAGASAPDVLVHNVVNRLQNWYPAIKITELMGPEENTIFPIPKELRLHTLS